MAAEQLTEIEEPKTEHVTPTPLPESAKRATTPTEIIPDTTPKSETTSSGDTITSPSPPPSQPRTPSPTAIVAGADTVPCVIDVNEVITEEATPKHGQLRVDDQISEVNFEENDITQHI